MPAPLPGANKPLQGQAGGKNTAYTMQKRLVSNKVHEFSLIHDFTKLGYRNREDITILPPGVLVIGSYNVLTNTNGRIGVTKGYTRDGQASTTLTDISSAYDFTKVLANDTHVRTWDTNLEFRYVHPVTGVVTWIPIYTSLVAANDVNYTAYWDTTQLSTVLLFVNGTPNIYRWSGAVASFASATNNTITLMGTSTWAQLGFDATTGSVIINGTTYAYTGGTGTTTLTGVTPDPTLGSYAVGTAIAQAVGVTANSSMTVITSTFKNDLIGNLDNQIFIGSKTSSVIYTSKVNNYKDYANSSPRLVGEGNTSTILDYPTAFVNSEDTLLVSSGKNIWYQTLFTQTTTSINVASVSVGTVYETLTYQRLKTTALQSAQSQAATTKIKNNIAFLSFEPIVNSFGNIPNYLDAPQMVDLSSSIVNDMNDYDFTDAAMIYFRKYLYLSVPREGIIRIYNMTQDKTEYWEAPVTFPIGRWSIINDELYGHGYNIPETYKLFDGYTFNGNAIPALALFSYENYGTRSYPKNFTQFYIEGYITSNCTLNYGINFDIDGCQTQRTYSISGTDSQVCRSSVEGGASLGKSSLGKNPLGGAIPTNTNASITGLPPKFRAIKQMSKLPFYEMQIFFQSLGKSQQWELIACGPSVAPATEGAVSIQY